MPTYRSRLGTPLGRLTPIAYLPRCRKTRAAARFLCRCSCGATTTVNASNLLKPNGTRSCGCLAAEGAAERHRTHGRSRTPEWLAWRNMRVRCGSKTHKHYADYGGRGIRVCKRWSESFAAFFADMGLRPSKRHTLERKNNDGNYCRGNCVWADRKRQANNRRNNRQLTFRGQRRTVTAWAAAVGLKLTTLFKRLSLGWPVARALSTPVRGSRPRP